MRWMVVVSVVAGCAFNNNNNPQVDAAGSGSGSDLTDGGTPPVMCTLSDLSLTAATLSGCSDAGTSDGARGYARFSNPVNVAMGPSGNAYVLDFDSSRIRKVDSTGNVTTLFVDKRFNRPFGMILSADGHIYVECDNDVNDSHGATSGTIWKIDPSAPYSANGALIVAQNLDRPRGLAELPNGQLAVSDYLTMVLYLLDPGTGSVTPLAGAAGATGHQDGTGAGATFNVPWDLVVDPTTNVLYVSEWGSHVIRTVALDGTVTLYSGTPDVPGHQDGPVATATWNNPKGMAFDPTTRAIYVTDTGNHTIRKIQGGMVTTVAGKIDGGYDDNTDPMAAEFYGIEGLDVTSDSKQLVVADGNDGDGTAFNHVRVITLP
jgi:DNA-binding beta-propeller fold protein YncE